MMLGMIFLFVVLFFGILRVALRLAWGTAKFLFGLGLFFFCPLLFVIAVMLGWLGHMWIPILIVALIFGNRFRAY